jgi:hypothetical protein
LLCFIDGGRDASDRKFQTSLKRANQRLNDGCLINAGLVDNKRTSKNLTKLSLETLVQSGNFDG